VQASFPLFPLNDIAGWGFMVLTNTLPSHGNGTFQFWIYADDLEGHKTLLGTLTITCDNAAATSPFGTIDTPTQGATISGSDYPVFGWVLSRVRRTDPPGGGTVIVYVDGVEVGRPGGWTSRPDLTALFTGFFDVNSTLGVFGLDTRLLSDGLHTISWVAIDSAGVASGIGSRYFRVANATGAVDGVATATNPIELRPTEAPRSSGLLLSAIDSVPLDTARLEVRRGWDPRAAWSSSPVDSVGRTVIRGEEMDRIEFVPSSASDAEYTMHLRTADGLMPLPIGSTIDQSTGRFIWSPGVGYVGSYDFVAVRWSASRPVARHDITIVLAPKGTERVGT
jgi:hypothetical protein